MHETGSRWFADLRRFAGTCREQNPLPCRERLTPDAEIQCRIVGGSLIAWLERHGPLLLRERAAVCALEQLERDPFIVFTSDVAGLVAADEIVGGGHNRIATLLTGEFDAWRSENPDPAYRWHIHTWSCFSEPEDADLVNVPPHLLQRDETYWLHKEGTMTGRLCGRGGDHLWKWNGVEPVLLKECLNQWVA